MNRIEDITTASPIELIHSQLASLEVRQRLIAAEIKVLKQIVKNLENSDPINHPQYASESEETIVEI